MGFRIDSGTRRPPPIGFTFDGRTIAAHPGETLAAALIAANIRGFRRDLNGGWRGPYCNMGTCFECVLEVQVRTRTEEGMPEERWRSVRACLTPVAPGLVVRSRSLAGAREESDR